MNIISITAVAALLLASIESAESMMGQPKMPKMYLSQPTGLKGAFGLPNLELVDVPDEQGPVDYIEGMWDNAPVTVICVDPSEPEGNTVRSFYQQHVIPLPYDAYFRVKAGSSRFGSVMTTLWSSGKQCYVINNACKYTYEQHIANLSIKMLNKELSFNTVIDDITSVLKYAKFKDLCFNDNGYLQMRRHYGLIQTDQMTPRQQLEVYTSLHELISNLIKLKSNNQIDLNTLNTQVNNIIQYMGYPMAPISSPSGSRRNSFANTDPVSTLKS
ncbi:hypothetical protein BDF22DRAFT_741282 [Syncephalis plumigaleata]|nr:hypothetical protein BDF22DRAFT_741282 [Syncephalis plumigaleata]